MTRCGLFLGIGMRKVRQTTRRSSRGFTLLEFLISITILTLLVSILFNIFRETTRAWSISEKASDAYREARAALFLMSRDIQNSLISETTPLIINDASMNPQGATLPTEQRGTMFFTLLRPDLIESFNDRSDVCTVGYYLAWQTLPGTDNSAWSGTERTYVLNRYFLTSNGTWNDILTRTGMGTPFSQLILNSSTPPSANPLNGDETLARHVANFRVEYLREGNSVPFSNEVTYPVPPPDPLPPGYSVPRPIVQILVSLDALNRESAIKPPLVNNRNSWNLNQPLYENNVRRFTIRIDVPQPQTPLR